MLTILIWIIGDLKCWCLFFVVALLLSALKSSGIPYTSTFLKKVIANTATPLGSHDNFSVGYGVLQVCGVFGYILTCICICVSLHTSGTNLDAYVHVGTYVHVEAPTMQTYTDYIWTSVSIKRWVHSTFSLGFLMSSITVPHILWWWYTLWVLKCWNVSQLVNELHD